MCAVPKKSLPANSPAKSTAPDQAERQAQRAEVLHEDGRREQIEILSERTWSGILPRPEDFAKFGEIVPDAPERLLRMAEREQEHRIALEAQVIPANQRAGARGQWMGFVISVAALGLSAGTAYLGVPWLVSVALVGVPVLSVARTLVTAWREPRG